MKRPLSQNTHKLSQTVYITLLLAANTIVDASIICVISKTLYTILNLYRSVAADQIKRRLPKRQQIEPVSDKYKSLLRFGFVSPNVLYTSKEYIPNKTLRQHMK